MNLFKHLIDMWRPQFGDINPYYFAGVVADCAELITEIDETICADELALSIFDALCAKDS